MRKISIAFLCMILVVMSGCGAIDTLLGTSFSYEKLAQAVSDPSGSVAADLDGQTIEFTAYLASDAQPMDSDDTDINGKPYVYVYINRNQEIGLLVQVDGIKDLPAVGSIVDIKGKVDGYIYSSDESGRIEELHIIGKSISVHKPESTTINRKDTTKVEGGELQFTHGQYITNPDGTLDLIVYANAKNEDAVVFSPFSSVEVYQGDIFLESISSVARNSEGMDTNAMESYLTTDLKKGEKGLVYARFSGVQDTTTPITIEMYDDQFQQVYNFELPIK